MSQVQPRFDPDYPNYICCCCCHVTTGAKILAFLSTIGAVLYAIAFFYGISLLGEVDPQTDKGYIAYILLEFMGIGLGIGLIIGTPILGCLWYGLIKEREGFLIPTLVCSVISLVVTCVYGCPIIFHDRSLVAEDYYVEILFGWLCSIALQYWYFNIYKNAYDYIKHKRWSPLDDFGHVRQSEKEYIAEPKETAEA
uniref:DUF7027 domain-containing protein n=1 Tax=Plectus sambesii TaxID=2011161 RepID=A0A914X2S0_9BILA